MKRPPLWLSKLANTSDGLFVVNSGQKIVLWNKSAEKLLGHSELAVRGRHCYEVIAGRTGGKERTGCHADCHVQRALSNDKLPPNFDLVVRAKDGRETCVNMSTIILSRNGSPLLVHLMRDVSTQMRDREAMERILDAMKAAGFPRRETDRIPLSQAEPGAAHDKPLSHLTGREVEILSLVAAGSSNKVIAKRLCLSHYTVRNHIQNTLDKLGLHSKAQAVTYAFRNGLV